ncbi:hypothetical protein GCM10022221_62770 [Actinocorallia aurea]
MIAMLARTTDISADELFTSAALDQARSLAVPRCRRGPGGGPGPRLRDRLRWGRCSGDAWRVEERGR